MNKHDEISEFLTCVIYGHDIVPRLSFNGLILTKAAITVLLSELAETDNGPWWVYRKAMTMDKYTILDALPPDCKYCNYDNYNESKSNAKGMEVKDDDIKDDDIKEYDEDDDIIEPSLQRSAAETRFMQDIKDMVDEIRQNYDKLLAEDFKRKYPDEQFKGSRQDSSFRQLWTIRFCQAGNVVFIVKADDDKDDDITTNECCKCMGNCCHVLCHSMIGNVCRCRCCLNAKDEKYVAYRANIDLFCDKMIFSQYMMPDHMPHLYLDVLQKLNHDWSILTLVY